MVSDTQHVLEARGLKKNRRREPGHITTEQVLESVGAGLPANSS